MTARRMVDLIPRLANLRVRRTWRGLYPMTPDALPIIGWTREVEGYLLAVGMCGQGFMLGPGVGELLARMVRRTAHEAGRGGPRLRLALSRIQGARKAPVSPRPAHRRMSFRPSNGTMVIGIS